MCDERPFCLCSKSLPLRSWITSAKITRKESIHYKNLRFFGDKYKVTHFSASILSTQQEEGKAKAQLIELNIDLVEKACLVIRSAVANAMDWSDIELLVKDAQARSDPVAMAIHGLKLQTNEITLLLRYMCVTYQFLIGFGQTKFNNLRSWC